MGKLESGVFYPAMSAPTLEFVNDENGGYWEVSYAGMVKRHRQDWQAWWLYELAQVAYGIRYAVTELPNCCTPEPKGDHDPAQQ
jgi:hypothetical protein